MTDIIMIAVGVLFAVAAGASVFRIVRGPAILDRMIASDMLVTTLILVMGAEMVYHQHTRTIPIMIVLAAVAVFASMAVARYVSKQGGGKPTVPVRGSARKRRRAQ
jgi:multicomponent Na+:H+ antiporter subunit F